MTSAAHDLNALSDVEFRARFRAWLDESYPAEWRQDTCRPFRRLRGADVRRWVNMLYDGGWRSPAWPKEYGGAGLDFRKQLIYQEELERIGAARVIDLGDVQLGPTLMIHGSEEQKARYLPPILNGAHLWCQGYSEPGAGSDLASLTTSGEVVGDHLRVNGQKTWTTHAEEASHIFALVRTSQGQRKQEGISFVLIAMDTPGIQLRPIRNLAGEEEFCEVFFDNVEVPLDDVVGGLGNGWTVAKALLGYERVWIGSPGLAGRGMDFASRLLCEHICDPAMQDRFDECAADLHDLRALYASSCDEIASGAAPGPEVSMLKVISSELLQRISEFNLELGAARSAIDGEMEVGTERFDFGWQYFMARPGTIFAGSNEIQRNVMAKSLLGLT